MAVAPGTNSWANETVIRRRNTNTFNKREEDFPSLREYHDYLEEVGDMTFSLTEGINVLASEAKIAKYQEENAEQINSRDRKTEELAAAVRASQYVGQADPADGDAGPSSQGVSNRGRYASTAIPCAGLMQPRPTGMVRQPVPVGAPTHPLRGYVGENEEIMKLQAEWSCRAGGWTIELSRKRAIEEAFSSILI